MTSTPEGRKEGSATIKNFHCSVHGYITPHPICPKCAPTPSQGGKAGEVDDDKQRTCTICGLLEWAAEEHKLGCYSTGGHQWKDDEAGEGKEWEENVRRKIASIVEAHGFYTASLKQKPYAHFMVANGEVDGLIKIIRSLLTAEREAERTRIREELSKILDDFSDVLLTGHDCESINACTFYDKVSPFGARLSALLDNPDENGN